MCIIPYINQCGIFIKCIIKHKTIFLAMDRHIPSNTRIILGKRLYWMCISMMTVGLFKIDQHNW
jgi:hypothetical protein